MTKGKQRGLCLLFVCGGNTCRSPMAAGIAQKILQEGVAHIESAGIYAYGSKATQEAIEAMQRHFGIDISGHQPQDVENLSLSDFDYIIAMGSYEYERLRVHHQVAPSKLIKCDIEDPYLQGVEAYKKCAIEIQKCMQDLLTILTGNSRLVHSTARGVSMAQDPNLSEAIAQLRTNIDRWKDELETGKLRGTLLIGIGGKAASTFDKLLRDLLEFYLLTCSVNYDQMLRKDMQSKSLDKLTMGQALQCYEKMNKLFTKCCRLLSPKVAQRLKNRDLLTKPIAKQLGQVIKIRNTLYHPEEYAKDVATLENDIGRMLILIQDILADALFDIVLLHRHEGKQV